MSNSELVQISDAVVTELNAVKTPPWGLVFTAVRKWHPISKPEDLQTLKVTVVPFKEVEEPLSRDKDYYTYTVHVLIQQRFGDEENATIDPLDKLAEDVEDFFKLRSLTQYPLGAVTRVGRPAVSSPDHWEQFRVFTTVIELEVSTSR